MAFIEANREQPFFCYVPFNTPHSPMQVPDEYWNRFKNKPLEMLHDTPAQEDINHTRAALAMPSALPPLEPPGRPAIVKRQVHQ